MLKDERFFHRWIGISALFIGFGVILGAFGAHAFAGMLSEHAMSIYEKAAFYHLTQSFGLFGVAVAAELGALPRKAARMSCLLLGFGVVIFSGSLYLLAVTGFTKLGMVTPLGGLAFITAWISLGVQVLIASRRDSSTQRDGS